MPCATRRARPCRSSSRTNWRCVVSATKASARMRCFGPTRDPQHGRHVDVVQHFALPQRAQHAAHARRRHAKRHAPAGAAAAQAHHQAGLVAACRGSGATGCTGAVVAAHQPGLSARRAEARRPHERAVAEDPQIAARQGVEKLGDLHLAAFYNRRGMAEKRRPPSSGATCRKRSRSPRATAACRWKPCATTSRRPACTTC